MKGPNEATHELLGRIVQAPSKNWFDQSLDHAVNHIEDFLLSRALSAAVLFAAISVIFYTITATTRLSKIILFGRQTVMMQPSSALACFTLVAYFAGQVDAIFYVDKGLCLNQAVGDTSISCSASDIKITSVTRDPTSPPVCPEGQYVDVTISTILNVTSKTRYDIGIYVGLGGANAKISLGDSCLVQSLSDGVETDPLGIVDDLDDDACLDSGAGTIIGFLIEDFTVFCKYNSAVVTVSVCLVWDNNRADVCEKKCANETQKTCLTPGTDAVSNPRRFFSLVLY
jgi:hypothetical protein